MRFGTCPVRVWIKLLCMGLLVGVSDGCGPPSPGSEESEPLPSQGPYIGMEPPGNEPELFAPGIVADVMNEHSPAIFSPDGRELFWSVVTSANPGIQRWVMVHMEQVDGVWSPPRIFSLAHDGQSHVHSISPDGSRLYFSHEGEALVSERGDSGWADPQPLPTGIKPDGAGQYVFDLQEANSGNVYFVGPINDGPRGWGILVSEKHGGEYHRPLPLGEHVNSGNEEETPFVDPEERFILFASNRPGGFGDQDLYVSHRLGDGSWGEAINLGPRINSSAGERYPRISPDRRYLFFVSTRTDFADQEHFDQQTLSLSELRSVSTGIKNGLGNIYWVSIESLEGLNPTRGSDRGGNPEPYGPGSTKPT